MADEKEIPFTDEHWTYMGQNSASTSGAHLWRDPSGQIHPYNKVKARIFGGIYVVKVKRYSTKDIRAALNPVYSGRMAEDAAIIQVRATEAENILKAWRLAKNTSRTATIDNAMADLLEIARKCVGRSDRYAIAEYVRQKIMEA